MDFCPSRLTKLQRDLVQASLALPKQGGDR